MQRLALTLAALLGLTAAAIAQEPPGDAKFCSTYAAVTSLVANDAIHRNPACQDFSKGVHAHTKMHVDWCGRTPKGEVEGASIHIRRLASRCTKGELAMPTEYGGYDIVGNERFEGTYGEARRWQVVAAYSGRTFMYCSAVMKAGGREIRIGRDYADPGASGQWQLAVPVKSADAWQGSFKVDGKGTINGGNSVVSGVPVGDWSIAWLSMGEVDGMRKGKSATLEIGKQGYAFPLDGAAAAILKVEECVQRKGIAG